MVGRSEIITFTENIAGSRPCSSDESFETVEIVEELTGAVAAVREEEKAASTSGAESTSRRSYPLTAEELQAFVDQDGRLVDEHGLRKAVFLGGVDPSIRKTVWQFLFGLYPCSSTARERKTLLLDYAVKYHELRNRWRTLLVVEAKPGDSLVEMGLVGKYQLKDRETPTSLEVNLDPLTLNPTDESQSEAIAAKVMATPFDPSILGTCELASELASPEKQQEIDFMKIQAQVYVNRHKVEVAKLKPYIRVIDKDVPRTDRDVDFFKGRGNPHLSQLRNILVTTAAYCPELGYAQGMNDILARFLFVMENEVETFWIFRNYMETIAEDFSEDGMLKKIELVRMLLGEVDPKLLRHFEHTELDNLFFCHRWLLLGFKREFSFLDSLKCFEILSSHHLELFSLEAEKARNREEMKEFTSSGGDTRTTRTEMKEYTFEIFMTAALLMENRDIFLACADAATVFSIINSIQIDLDSLLRKSEKLFFSYCKKSVEESFSLVTAESVPKTLPGSHPSFLGRLGLNSGAKQS